MSMNELIPKKRSLENPVITQLQVPAACLTKPVRLARPSVLRGASAVRKRFLIIHNPIAGMRRRWMLREVCRNLRASGADLIVANANSLEADRQLAHQAVQSHAFDAVVAAGGDSTIRGVASGLVGSNLPLCIIPIGTGNVLAHEIGIRKGPKEVARYIMENPSIPVSTGSANGEPFCLMASVGFDARILARLDTAWKRYMGKLAYIWPVIKELMVKQPVFDVQIDGRRHQCTWLIVTKVRHYAGPFQIAREQHLRSDKFHALLINAPTALDLMSVILAIGLGKVQDHPNVEIKSCGHVMVPGGQDVATQLDGEVFVPPPLRIKMDNKKIELVIARESRV